MGKLSDKNLEHLFKEYIAPAITENMIEYIKFAKKRDEKLMEAFGVKKAPVSGRHGMEEYCCSTLWNVMENTLGGKSIIQKGAEWFILNDSWIDHGDGGTELRIYYCPFCGEKL